MAMKKKSFANMPCPIALSLEHVGDWWNILILRDLSYGLCRFDEFEKSLGIAPSTLTNRCVMTTCSPKAAATSAPWC
jgi:DNA-binding HxlR family transcriptional regulator